MYILKYLKTNTKTQPVGVADDTEAAEEGHQTRQRQERGTVPPEDAKFHEAKRSKGAPGRVQPGAQLRQLMLGVDAESVHH